MSYWLLIPFIFFFIYNTVNKKKPLIKKGRLKWRLKDSFSFLFFSNKVHRPSILLPFPPDYLPNMLIILFISSSYFLDFFYHGSFNHFYSTSTFTLENFLLYSLRLFFNLVMIILDIMLGIEDTYRPCKFGSFIKKLELPFNEIWFMF